MNLSFSKIPEILIPYGVRSKFKSRIFHYLNLHKIGLGWEEASQQKSSQPQPLQNSSLDLKAYKVRDTF
jgi:hypothetical protein